MVLTKSTPVKPGSLLQGKTGVDLVWILVLGSLGLVDVVEAVVVAVVDVLSVVLVLLSSTFFLDGRRTGRFVEDLFLATAVAAVGMRPVAVG